MTVAARSTDPPALARLVDLERLTTGVSVLATEPTLVLAPAWTRWAIVPGSTGCERSLSSPSSSTTPASCSPTATRGCPVGSSASRSSSWSPATSSRRCCWRSRAPAAVSRCATSGCAAPGGCSPRWRRCSSPSPRGRRSGAAPSRRPSCGAICRGRSCTPATGVRSSATSRTTRATRCCGTCGASPSRSSGTSCGHWRLSHSWACQVRAGRASLRGSASQRWC